MTNAKHEAPAEGAGSWMKRLADVQIGRDVDQVYFDFPHREATFLGDLGRALIDLRARSSAPEALGNLLAVIHGDGGHRALEVGVEQAAAEAEKIVARLLSSAPEAREHPCYGEHQPGCDCVIPAQTEREVPSFLKRMTEASEGYPPAAWGCVARLSDNTPWEAFAATEDQPDPAGAWSEIIPLYTHPAAPTADKLLEAAYQSGFEHGLGCHGELDAELQEHVHGGFHSFLNRNKGDQVEALSNPASLQADGAK